MTSGMKLFREFFCVKSTSITGYTTVASVNDHLHKTYWCIITLCVKNQHVTDCSAARQVSQLNGLVNKQSYMMY